jgi:DNA mismatch repair protein MutS2
MTIFMERRVDTDSNAPERDRIRAKSQASLGWPELLAALAARAASAPGKRECAEPALADNAPACDVALTETAEMNTLFEQGEAPPPTPIAELAPLIETARAGGVLEPADLVKIGDLLGHARAIAAFFKVRPQETRIAQHAARIDDLNSLRHDLERAIDRDGSILDTASPNLKTLRNRRATLNERIHRRLGEIVARESDSVLQDDFYTQRGHRYVVPVKASARASFAGIVHDASASGQTVFVEPAELVEPNNQLKLIEAEIEEEIRRILRELSAAVGGDADAIITDSRVLGHLDAVRARARLAQDLHASRPAMNDEGGIRLKNARHPLLALRGLNVVANDLELGREARVLLVSGPNAGGKTVGLTMLGLIALMVRAGMFIPADPDSEMAVCPEVLAAIGDEQDLSRDLSSFAGHLRDLHAILAIAGPNSLVLLDELMSSTDPEEGSALGMALLTDLRDRGARVMATTHFPALKSFAHEQDGFLNASYTFDPPSLAPTYRLLLGVPGRSMGIEMAGRLGLPPALIAAARARLDDSTLHLESLLASLAERLRRLDEEGAELDHLQDEARKQARQYQLMLREVEARDKKLRDQTGAAVRDAVRAAEAEAQAVLDELRGNPHRTNVDASNTYKKLRTLRSRLDSEYADQPAATGVLDLRRLAPGDRVKVMPLGVESEVVALPGGELRLDSQIKVKMGRMTVTVPASKLVPLPPPEAPRGEKLLQPAPKKPKPAKPRPRPAEIQRDLTGTVLPPSKVNTLDLRGLRAMEAEARVDHFLDRATMDNLANIFIIHGHGTGALKAMVRELLASSPYIDTFRPGERGEGGDGVTMAMLKLGAG